MSESTSILTAEIADLRAKLEQAGGLLRAALDDDEAVREVVGKARGMNSPAGPLAQIVVGALSDLRAAALRDAADLCARRADVYRLGIIDSRRFKSAPGEYADTLMGGEAQACTDSIRGLAAGEIQESGPVLSVSGARLDETGHAPRMSGAPPRSDGRAVLLCRPRVRAGRGEGTEMTDTPNTPLAETLRLHRAWARGEPGGSRANLAGANLAGANLADAYLAGAYLAGAYLAGADLARANLARANLARANLARANLADAYLADAYLAGAYLADAYLAGANLAGANLAGAYLADGIKALDAHAFLAIGPVGSRGDSLLCWRTTVGLRLSTGCRKFVPSSAMLAAVVETHGDGPRGAEYRAAVAMAVAWDVAWTVAAPVAGKETT